MHHLHDRDHQLWPHDEAGHGQQVYPSTLSTGQEEDYAVAHALLHMDREEVGLWDILYSTVHVLEPTLHLLQGKFQASFGTFLKQKLTHYFPETGPGCEDCHHAHVPQPPALQGHHHHHCRDVQRGDQGQL